MKIKLLIVCLVLCACNEKKVHHYGPVEFAKDANMSLLPVWEDKDTMMVLKWVSSLQDTTISDYQFHNTVGALSDKTAFAYGMFNPGDKEYWQIPLKIRNLNKQNIAEVYQLYTHSKAFMKKIDYEKSILLQDKYWNNTTRLSKEQIREIKMTIDSLVSDGRVVYPSSRE